MNRYCNLQLQLKNMKLEHAPTRTQLAETAKRRRKELTDRMVHYGIDVASLKDGTRARLERIHSKRTLAGPRGRVVYGLRWAPWSI